MRKLLSTICGLALLALVNPAGAVVMLNLTPSSQTADPGDGVSIDLVISGLSSGGPDSLGDFDIDIGFDLGALSFLGYTLGPSLGDIGAGEAVDFSFGDLGGGMVNLAEVSLLLPFELDAIQADSFTLATFDFMVDVLPMGSTTTVSIDTVFALGDGFGQPLELGDTSNAVIRNPSAEMPEPSTLVLMLMGLTGVHLVRRRRV